MEKRGIHSLRKRHLTEAMALVWRVFLEFEAPDYPPEGAEEFRRFIAVEEMERRMDEGMRLWGSFAADELVGVIALRPPAHVSLLFVDKRCHRQGIARALWDAAREPYRQAGEVTVNASPYAREAYLRLGFRAEGGERLVNGLRFFPMRYTFELE